MSELTNYERETIISYNEAEKTANVYTHNKSLRRKLEKLAAERPEECWLEKVSRFGEAVDYTVPKAWVKITPTRILSEEQRAAKAATIRKTILKRQDTLLNGVVDGPAAETSKDTSDGSEPVESGRAERK